MSTHSLPADTMGATQQDIADALGISLITVHRALNDSGYVSDRMRKRILAYAKKVDYVPHKASQVLLRNKVRKIALFSSSLPHYFWSDIRTGISIATHQLQALNYQVHYHTVTERDSRMYLAKLKRELDDGVEAVAVVNQWIFDMPEVFSAIERRGIPYITLNVDAPDSKRLFYIGPDYPVGGRLAAEYIGKTLRFARAPRVLVVTTEAEAPPAAGAPDINSLRCEGFLQVMSGRFPRVRHEICRLTADIRSRELEALIADILTSKRADADAIYFIPAYNAQFVQALERTGRREMITVMHELDASSDRCLDTNPFAAVVYQNPVLQGYYAVRTLEAILESGHLPPTKRITLEHSLILRENKEYCKNRYLYAGLVEQVPPLAR